LTLRGQRAVACLDETDPLVGGVNALFQGGTWTVEKALWIDY